MTVALDVAGIRYGAICRSVGHNRHFYNDSVKFNVKFDGVAVGVVEHGNAIFFHCVLQNLVQSILIDICCMADYLKLLPATIP